MDQPSFDTASEALDHWARTDPGRTFLVTGGQSHSYQAVRDGAAGVAAGLERYGIGPGDRIAVLAGNCLEYVLTWLGASLLSAVDVPVNVHAKGAFLDYTLHDAAPAAAVCTPEYLPRILGARSGLPGLRLVSLIGEDTGPDEDAVVPFSDVLADGHRDRELPVSSTLATLMYTSGTTGPSKGVMLPQGFYPWYGMAAGGLAAMGPGERMYCAQPLFHIDGRAAVMSALMSGGAVVLARRFSASRFWADIRASQSTRFFYVGSMVWMLYKQPERREDAEQPARIGLGSATPVEIHRAFERRFRTSLIDTFGMTETALLTGAPVADRRPGTMGKPLPGMEVRLLDDEDREVAPGRTGEIAFRPGAPGIAPLGYWNKPEATVAAWRNLWFHTGDLARRDTEGYLSYVGRKKDVIRRRGENISAWEVEQAFLRLDPVAEVAAIGVAAEFGEEELAVLVVLRPGHQVPAERLCQLISMNLPAFMVPRYIEFVGSLPKTASHRVEKAKVRERGITNAAWDSSMSPGPAKPQGGERG